MSRKLRTGVLALAVLLAGLGLAAPVSATDTYNDGDQSIAVVVNWDDTAVSDGNTASLTVNNTANTNTETIDVTVREATSTETTYWIDYSDLSAVSPADAETIDVTLSTTTDGTISVDESVAYDGDTTIGVSDGEGIETNVTVNDTYSSLPVDVDLAVISEDGSTVLNRSTLGSLNGSEAQYSEFYPSITNTSNVTVQVDYVSDGTNPQFDAVESYNANRITVGIFGGGSGGNSTLFLLAGAAVVGFVLFRD